MLSAVRQAVLPVLCKREPVRAWIVDDTGFPKQGQHSVGVARQYCGQLGKQDNCQVAVSVSVASTAASLPIAYQLYLPEEWAADRARRTKAGVPDTVGFVTKPQMAVAMIRKAVEDQVPVGVVLADAGYGNDSKCREALTEMGLIYAVGVQHSMTVRSPGHGPLAAQAVRRWGDGTASHIAATRPGATADNLETTGHAAAGAGLQDHLLAGRRGRMAHFALCPNPRSLGPSRLLAQQTSPGAMAAH